MTIAELLINVDSSGVRTATRNIRELESRLDGASTAMNGLNASIRRFNALSSSTTLPSGGGGGGGGATGVGGGGTGGGGGNLLGGLSNMLRSGGGLLSGAGGGMGMLGNFGSLIQGGTSLISTFQQVGSTITTALGGVGTAVAGVATGVLAGVGLVIGGIAKFNEAFFSIVGTVANVAGQVLGKVAEIVGGILDMATQVAGAVGQAAMAFTQFAIEVGQSAFQTFSRLDQLSRGLALYSDSAEDFKKTFKDLRELAKLPGLGLEEVMEATTSLRAAGLGAEKTRESILGIGRALAAVGKGKGDFKGTMLALQQMVTAGKVEGDEIRQLSERVPQIRRVLMEAFGSAKGKDISKLMEETGMTIYDVIDKINKELLKIPGTTASVAVNLENIQDDLKLAFAPLGQGIAQMVSAAMPGMGSLIEMFKTVTTKIGEAFYALGESGVIQEAIKTLIGGIDADTIATNLQDIAIRVMTFITAAIQNIPKIYDALKTATTGFASGFTKIWEKVVNEVTYYFLRFKLEGEAVFTALSYAVQPFIEAFKAVAKVAGSLGSQLASIAGGIGKMLVGDIVGAGIDFAKGSELAGAIGQMFMAPMASTVNFAAAYGEQQQGLDMARTMLQGARESGLLGKGAGAGISNFFDEAFAGAGLTGVQDAFGQVGKDAATMYGRVKSALKPLPEMVPDKFGKSPTEEALGKQAEKEDSNTLKEIAENTGKTADRLSLRTQTLGGGELAKLGVTGTELGSGGSPNISGIISARNKMMDASRPSDSTIRSAPTQLEEAITGIQRLNIRRGAGTSVRL